MSTKRIFYMKAFNLVLTGLLLGIIVWLLVTLILGVIYQPEYSNDIKVTVNFNNKPVEGIETVETTRQVPVTCPFSGETKTSDVKTIVKKTQLKPSERRVVITEDAFKETMQKVAYTARLEAQNEYDKNFTTLLTILTIFGIAWPVIIALLQFKFNENELNKIKQAQNDAQQAIENANKALEQSDVSFNSVKKLVDIVEKLQKDIINRNALLLDIMNTSFAAMAVQPQLQNENNKAYVNHYYILALQCLIWKNQISGSSFLSSDDTSKIMNNLNLINPEKTVCYVTQSNYNFLEQGKIALQNHLQVTGQQSIDVTVKMFTLMEQKIEAYKQLLMTENSK